MSKNSAIYDQQDLAAVANYVVALADEDPEVREAALEQVLDRHPVATMHAALHLMGGLIHRSADPEQSIAALFQLVGDIGDTLALVDGEG